MSSNRSEKLVKNTAILTFGKICTRGIMFIMTPLFTRWLSQSDYGTFDLIVTYITFLMPIITLECAEAVFRHLLDAKEERDKKSIITNAVVIDLIGFIICILITAILAISFEQIRNVAVYFVILLISETINTLMTMILRGLKMLPTYTVANIIYVIAMIISVTILVKFMNLGLAGIILGYSIGYLVSSIFIIIRSKFLQYVSFKCFDKLMAKRMLKYSLPMIPNTLSWWIVDASDRTIVSTILGSSTNAILAVAHKIPNLCQTIFSVFHMSWQENATETINDKDRDKYYSSIMNNMFVILTSICVLILSGNFIIFKVLFTEEYFSAYYQVPILMISIVLSMLAQFIGGIYVAKMESKTNGTTTIIAAIINIIVHLALINFIGLYAATISTLVAYLALFIIRYVKVKKEIDLKFSKSVYIAAGMLIYMTIINYINNMVLNILNVGVAIVYFFIVNKDNMKKIMNKTLKIKK